jgi:hypothetical protein
MKDRFIDLLRMTNRPGIDALVVWMYEKTDFFTAPASTKYHGATEFGLLEHSLAVYDNLLKLKNIFEIGINRDTAAITSLLHDLCKANFYTVSQRNVKEDGVWKQVPYYAVEDQLPLGHGEKSVILLQAFIRPTVDEIMAIRWHMGSAGGGDYETNMARSAAMDRYPIVGLLHMADMAACFIDKK